MIMKKLLLLLLISNITIAQSGVEVRLVNANIGTPSCGYFLNDWLCNSTNDTGLNSILSNYGVSYFRQVEGHPYLPFQGRIFVISYSSNNTQLVADLTAYSNVIDNAVLINSAGFSDALYVQLNNAGIGFPTGMAGNIIVTNDMGLNQIFQTYNVYQYSSYLSSSTFYTLVCDCNGELLKAALNNYNAVIANSSNIQGVVLSNNEIEKPKAIISPNPFSDNFAIETEQTVSNYSIIDITGKTIISTSSKSELDNHSSQLSAGIYILNLDFDNGQKANYKLIKK
jgi:hypothetical protein